MPRDAGRVFAHTRPKLAAYTHIVRIGNERFAPPTVEDIVAETRKTYDGPLTVGEDLIAFELGETIAVLPPPPASQRPIDDS